MQRKCHRCDRLFTPDSHNTWCPDCRVGKPVEPRKTKEQLEQEREARLEKAFKLHKILCTVWKEIPHKLYT